MAKTNFIISADSKNALAAFFALREKAAQDFPQELSLEEINQEINNSRSTKKEPSRV